MPGKDLFGSIDVADHYVTRLRELADVQRSQITPTDRKAIESLLEERNALYELLRQIRHMRNDQREVDRAIERGVSGRSGLDEAQNRRRKAEQEVDAKVTLYLGPPK
jgi:hypothetical protein